MGITDALSYSLGRRDQEANIRVGERLAAEPDPSAVAELVATLDAEEGTLAGDASKALEELALRDSAQVAPHAAAIARHLASSDNRMVWGVTTVMRAVALKYPDAVAPHVGALIAAVNTGSVITQDHGIGALAATGDPAALDYAIKHVRDCGPTHVALRGERIAPYVGDRMPEFRDVLESRLPEVTDSAARRIRTLLAPTSG